MKQYVVQFPGDWRLFGPFDSLPDAQAFADDNGGGQVQRLTAPDSVR